MSKNKGITPTVTDRLIIDSSIVLSWFFADERGDYPQSILNALSSRSAIVPQLWQLEVANVLVVGERRGRCTQSDTVPRNSLRDRLQNRK